MPQMKGVSLVALRKVIKEHGVDFEKEFLTQLTPDEFELYELAVTTTWSPVEKQIPVYEKASRVLFPYSVEPMFELSKTLAHLSFTGIYKIFIRIPSVTFIISRAAHMWKLFWDTGQMTVENVIGKSADLVLRGYPQFPHVMLEYISGFPFALLVMTGAKNIRVEVNDTNPQAWRWHFTWE